MKSGVLSRWLINLICLVVPATMVLCCAPAIKPQKVSDTEILRKRAAEYWALRIKGDFDKNYEYEIPPYREKIRIVEYIMRQGQALKWTDAEVREVDVDGDRAKVEVFVRFNYQIPNFKMRTSADSLRENWGKFKGEWYHIPYGFIYQ